MPNPEGLNSDNIKFIDDVARPIRHWSQAETEKADEGLIRDAAERHRSMLGNVKGRDPVDSREMVLRAIDERIRLAKLQYEAIVGIPAPSRTAEIEPDTSSSDA